MTTTLTELIDAIFVEFAVWTSLGIAGIIGGSILLYFRSVKQCQRETATEVDKLNKRSFRQSQAILTMASVLDKQTNRLHKNEQSTLLADVERALKDERGNL